MLKIVPIKVGYYGVEKNYGATLVTPVFSKFKLSKNVKKFFFEIIELIDGNTGILCQKFSDSRIVPLSRKQIEIFVNDRNVGDALDELVAYGILARIDVSRTEFFVANPYIVNKGEHVNPFLLSIFNKDTLKKMDKYNLNFELSKQAQFDLFWEEMFRIGEDDTHGK